MAFIPAANTARVALLFDLDAQQVVNTLWFVRNVAWDIFSITDFIIDLVGFVEDNLMPHYSSSLTLVQGTARDYTTEFGVAASASSNVAGGETGECAPNNVSLAIHFGTGQVGRSRRGRNYIPGVPNSLIDTNDADPAWALQLLLNYAGLADHISGDWGAQHCVASFQENGVPLATANTWLVTEYLFVDLVADSQRRRLPGRGA